MEISVYSLIAIARRAREILDPGGSILTLTYLGGEKVIPGYNIMGVCKSALESSVEYLANDLGPAGIRVNALSAGPLKTLSSSAVGEFDKMLKLYTDIFAVASQHHAGRSRQDGHVSAERPGQRHHRRKRARRRRLPHHGRHADRTVLGEQAFSGRRSAVSRGTWVCPLPICLLPTAHSPLPTPHCPLPTPHCPLPTAHCPPLPHSGVEIHVP